MCRTKTFSKTIIILMVLSSIGIASVNKHYQGSRPPLKQTSYVHLPLGAVKPKGWLKNQLKIQADGLTGHLDEFWRLRQSVWKGDKADWERADDHYTASAAPNYLSGLVPLAYVLEDKRLIEKSNNYIDWILCSWQADGWFGSRKSFNRAPQTFIATILSEYYEATGDPRVVPLLTNYFNNIKQNPPSGWPQNIECGFDNAQAKNETLVKFYSDFMVEGIDRVSALDRLVLQGIRGMEIADCGYWLYNKTGESIILEAIDIVQSTTLDWTSHFNNFPWTEGSDIPGWQKKGISGFDSWSAHGVNIGMALKFPALYYLRDSDSRHQQAVKKGLKTIDKYHGQTGGRFSADEVLSGRQPTRGTEICAITESMFSLEKLFEVFGDIQFADRLEVLTYNALPGAHTPDFWAHQYFTQANQVLASHNTKLQPVDTTYGLEPLFMCCLCNIHQGWPRFVSHMWMATHDQGLIAATYGPCEVTAKVADGTEITIVEETDYPFDGLIRFKLKLPKPVKFPIHLRIPQWAKSATVRVGKKEKKAEAGTVSILEQTWKSDDTIELMLPMKIRIEKRYNNAVAILRGSLYFSLRIGQEYKKKKTHIEALSKSYPAIDWEIHPTTPWNYGLIIDANEPERYAKIRTNKVSSVPFAQRGEPVFQTTMELFQEPFDDANTCDRSKYYTQIIWQKNEPVILNVKGRQIPGWKINPEYSWADDTPISPVKSKEPLVDLELIPYGCTRLRITEFPVIDKSVTNKKE